MQCQIVDALRDTEVDVEAVGKVLSAGLQRPCAEGGGVVLRQRGCASAAVAGVHTYVRYVHAGSDSCLCAAVPVPAGGMQLHTHTPRPVVIQLPTASSPPASVSCRLHARDDCGSLVQPQAGQNGCGKPRMNTQTRQTRYERWMRCELPPGPPIPSTSPCSTFHRTY
jgi:hypothetical protein